MTGKQTTLKGNDVARHANWLELFYDLIYVIVIARLTHMIIGGYGTAIGFSEYFTYVVLFVPVWWTWTGHTLFLNRFGRDTKIERLLTFTQMFGLVLLAVFVVDGLSVQDNLGGGAKAFALAYAFVRFALVAMYIMAHKQNPEYRPLTKRLIFGFGLGATLWAGSIFFDPNIMFMLWVLGLGIDLLTPLFARGCLKKMPVHRSHLPERTGLLFIIVLGESLLVLVDSIKDVSLGADMILRLLLAFSLIVMVWWRYFDDIETALMGKLQGAAQLHIYGHLPIYLGVGLLAAFCYKILDGQIGTGSAGILLAVSLALIFLPLRALQFQYEQCDKKAAAITSCIMIGLLALIAWLGFILTPIVLTLVTLLLFISLTVWERRAQNMG